MCNDPLLQVPVTKPTERNMPGSRVYQGIPGFTISPKGRFFACWYSGGTGEGPDNYVLVAISDDRGRTWQDPVAVVDPPGRNIRAFDPCLWTDPKGRVCLFWAQSFSTARVNISDGVNGVWMSCLEHPDEDFTSWSAPRRIFDGIMLNKPTVLSDGAWGYPVSIWAEGIGNGIPPESLKPIVGANLVVSTDCGNTFQRRGSFLLDRSIFDEHMIVPLLDGRLWCLVRTQYGIGEGYSEDSGRTWINVGESKIYGPNSRFYVGRLKSGRLLMVNHKSNGKDGTPLRNNLSAFLSEDEGKTWSDGYMLDSRINVSYPDVCQDTDGGIWCIYDRERYKEANIILVNFTEDEILRGGEMPAERRLMVSSL